VATGAPSYRGVPVSGGDHQPVRLAVLPFPAQLPRSRKEDPGQAPALTTTASLSADQTAAVAAALAELGVRPAERVLIMLPDGPGFAEAFAGTIHQGAVPLPVNPLLPVAAEAGARLVLASVDQLHALADLDAEPPILIEGPRGPWAAALRLRLSEEFPSQSEGSSE
jgi:non-ribosomal peptide synthetase component F